MLASVCMVSSGGMTSPLRRSRVRWPVTKQSTVTTSTRYLAAAARSTSSLFSPLSRRMYSWNHRSGCAASATASMVVVAMVDSVYGSPRRCAARAAAISPPGCIIRVYPVGARASGSGATVDVVEDRAGDQPAPRRAQVIDVMTGRKPPAGRVALDRLDPDQLPYLRSSHVTDDTRPPGSVLPTQAPAVGAASMRLGQQVKRSCRDALAVRSDPGHGPA